MAFKNVFRDKNHMPILNHIRGLKSCTAIDLAAVGKSVPDLLATHGTTAVLIEIKMPQSQIYLTQLSFLAKWPGYCGFATTEEEAENLLLDPITHALTDIEKKIILEIVEEWKAKTRVKAGSATGAKIKVTELEKELTARKTALGIKYV